MKREVNEWLSEQYVKDAKPCEPTIVLTISRAKEVAKKLNDVGIQHEQDFGDFDYDALDLADCLNELIEKAEGTE